MKKNLTLFILMAIISACATKIFAPGLEATQTKDGIVTGGTVVYNPLGLEQLVDQRRNQAFKRMREACGAGKTFKILREETATPESRDEKYKGQVTNLTGTKVRFIDYRCQPL